MKWVIRWHCEKNEERYRDTTCNVGPFEDLNEAHHALNSNSWKGGMTAHDGLLWYVVEEECR